MPTPFPALHPVAAWKFAAPRQTHFGWGERRALGTLAAPLGDRALVLCGSRTLRASPRWSELLASLHTAGITTVEIQAPSREPLTTDVDQAVSAVKAQQLRPGDLVVGTGGGATLDLAKAVAALAPQAGDVAVQDFLEGVGSGRQLSTPPLPWIAVPTTAGTGSEATKNAVISSLSPTFKKSLRADQMLAQVALIDPELTVTNPPKLTAHSGLDAITQLIESYLSNRATPLTRMLALEGLRETPAALKQAFADPKNQPARERMAYAAYLSGLALANSGLGMAHGVAAALGAECGTSHGLACAMLLPVALQANREVCEPRLCELAAVLAPQRTPSADVLIEVIEELLTALEVPRRLGQVGVSAEQIPALVRGSNGNSMRGNPRQISAAELTRTLEALL